MGNKTIWDVAKIALAVALIGLVLARTDLAGLSGVWHRLDAPWLLGSVLAFLGGIGAMARRYWLLVGKRAHFRDVLRLVAFQTVIGNLVATTAGAASYVAILRSRHQIQVGHSIASLVLARLADMLVLLLGLSLSSWILWDQISALHWLVWILIVVPSAGVLLVVLTLFLRQRLVAWAVRVAERLRLNRVRLIRRLLEALDLLARHDVRSWRSYYLPVGGYTCLVFGLSLLFSYCNVRLFTLPIGAWPVLFILSLTQLFGLIPVQVFGGLGVNDVTSLYLYGLFGFAQAEMAPVVLGMRLVFYAINVAMIPSLLVSDSQVKARDVCEA